jgi:DNA-binding transcriptional ArsR family regulator
MTDPSHIQLTPQSIKALAHPLRVRLLWLLRERGPSTATRLAEIIGQSSGVTSYHLRQLAQHGFVIEDTERGNARDRWWKAAHRGSSVEAPAAREVPAETEVYMRAIAALYAERVDRWLYELPSLPQEWDDAADMSDYALRLTAEEAGNLLREMQRIIRSYRRDVPENPAPEGAEAVVLQMQLMPFIGLPTAAERTGEVES